MAYSIIYLMAYFFLQHLKHGLCCVLRTRDSTGRGCGQRTALLLGAMVVCSGRYELHFLEAQGVRKIVLFLKCL